MRATLITGQRYTALANIPNDTQPNSKLSIRSRVLWEAGLHNNPVEAGFVSNPEDWIYSSAIDYSEGKGLWTLYLFNKKVQADACLPTGRLALE